MFVLRQGLLLGPVVDGDVVTDPVEIAVARGANAAVPLVLGCTDDELSGLFHPGGAIDRLPRHALLLALGAKAGAARRWFAEPAVRATEGSALMLGRYASDVILRSTVPRVAAARAAEPAAGPTWSYPGTPTSLRGPGTASTCRSSSTGSTPRAERRRIRAAAGARRRRPRLPRRARARPRSRMGSGSWRIRPEPHLRRARARRGRCLCAAPGAARSLTVGFRVPGRARAVPIPGPTHTHPP